jgi:putative hydrolase of the HAD superfamily
VQSAASVEAPEVRRLVNGVRAAYTDAKGWQVFDDMLPALARLRDHSWNHLVLSNHVPELPQLVEDLGLSDFITAVYCSACTGVEKPHRQAFETMFARYPEALSGWMIGDS